jgi:hypothetical protein
MFLEGSWARANQKSLVKMHSPMRFSLALTEFGVHAGSGPALNHCAGVLPVGLLVSCSVRSRSSAHET